MDYRESVGRKVIYQTAKQLIDREVSNQDLYALYSVIKLGESVCDEIINEHSELFSSKYCIGDRASLRRAAIYSQFEYELLAKDFPFKCSALKVNNFGKYVPELRKGQLILHIAKAQHVNELPSVSKYKEEKALLNNFKSKQQSLIHDDIVKLDDDRYYGIITFGGKNKLEFIDLVIPSYNYKEVLEHKELTHITFESKKIKKESNEEMRNRRMSLKQVMINKLEKQGE